MKNISVDSRVKLCVVTSIPFPSSTAAANRIISYSKGLIELGESVTVLSLGMKQDSSTGRFQGIKCKSFRKSASLAIVNMVMLPLAIVRLCLYLFQHASRFTEVLIVSNSPALILPLYAICKLRRLRMLQEKSEFPFVLNKKSALGKIYAGVYVNTLYKLFDGMIIMTHPLHNYFKDKVRGDCRLIVVPMTVEPERFDNISLDLSFQNCITYCGYMGGNKDGVINLINSFAKVNKNFPDHKLLLIGSAPKQEMDQIRSIAQKLGINNIWFFGHADREQIPNLLANSKLLVLARPSSLQSTGGFPTKLGEYLATGKPVVVTKVGDIPQYLVHLEHAFLVAPDNNDDFAAAIEYMLLNYEQAKQMGKRGKELTLTTFNYRIQAERIRQFLINS